MNTLSEINFVSSYGPDIHEIKHGNTVYTIYTLPNRGAMLHHAFNYTIGWLYIDPDYFCLTGVQLAEHIERDGRQITLEFHDIQDQAVWTYACQDGVDNEELEHVVCMAKIICDQFTF